MISDTNLIIVAQKPFSPFSLILSFHVFQARDFVNEVVCVFNGQFVCRFSVCRSISPLVHIFPSIALQSFTYSRLQSFTVVCSLLLTRRGRHRARNWSPAVDFSLSQRITAKTSPTGHRCFRTVSLRVLNLVLNMWCKWRDRWTNREIKQQRKRLLKVKTRLSII